MNIEIPWWLLAALVGLATPFFVSLVRHFFQALPAVVHCIVFLRAAKREGTKEDFAHALRHLLGTYTDLRNHGAENVQERLTDKLLFDFRNWTVIAPYLDEHEWAQKLWRPIQNGDKQFRTLYDGSVIAFHRHTLKVGNEDCPSLIVEFSASKKQMEKDSGEFAVALSRFMEMMRTFDPTLCGVATICTDHIPHISTLTPTRILNGWYGADLDFYDARKDIP